MISLDRDLWGDIKGLCPCECKALSVWFFLRFKRLHSFSQHRSQLSSLSSLCKSFTKRSGIHSTLWSFPLDSLFFLQVQFFSLGILSFPLAVMRGNCAARPTMRLGTPVRLAEKRRRVFVGSNSGSPTLLIPDPLSLSYSGVVFSWVKARASMRQHRECKHINISTDWATFTAAHTHTHAGLRSNSLDLLLSRIYFMDIPTWAWFKKENQVQAESKSLSKGLRGFPRGNQAQHYVKCLKLLYIESTH